MVTKIIKVKPFSCLALKATKAKNPNTTGYKFEYAFEISKADQIFYYLLKDQQIQLMDGHKIPSSEKIKDKKYCRWHNSYNHNSSKCWVFWQAI
ncbi:hypothetical protein JHK82_035558 [Glycine max]|uniref:Uncharacterized protein n=2 Tax=Glycine subgen. Soja TaxID=1462606 RepID=A0A0R0GJI7_SOYBN|nr:hypothetical protein JHK87_035485 [Glycine soja]KAG4969859.1 hypothetical protein JHK85_036280 [Glycine max]KAG4976216.1 hypothetical protein JHK86_035690 [Glycine max]KAG5112289.1 hypothetical protein JHK82_035558 [Glycine max]KAG5129568.1 hypothetical protein JHK84_035965 [Glycine max]